jgi:hypothetical protein
MVTWRIDRDIDTARSDGGGATHQEVDVARWRRTVEVATLVAVQA